MDLFRRAMREGGKRTAILAPIPDVALAPFAAALRRAKGDGESPDEINIAALTRKVNRP
jgi:hypothetical protein